MMATATDLGHYSVGETIPLKIETFDEAGDPAAPNGLEVLVTEYQTAAVNHVLDGANDIFENPSTGVYILPFVATTPGPVTLHTTIESPDRVVDEDAFAFVEGLVTLPYNALTTPRQAVTAAHGTLPETLRESAYTGAGSEYEALVEACMMATGIIEEYLGRVLIVAPQTLRFRSSDWRTRPGFQADADTALITAYAREWPVVEVRAVDGVAGDASELSLHRLGEPAEVLAYNPQTTTLTSAPSYVDVFAGYRRADQALAALQAETGLSALSVLPAVLPPLITGTANRIAVACLRVDTLGLVGLASVRKEVERMTVSAQIPDTDFVLHQLQRLHAYRYVPA